MQSTASFTLADGVENLTLQGTAISGTGNGGINQITGNASNNTLDGGTDADTLTGGEGNDTYLVDNTGDVVSEAGVGDTDEVQTKVNLPALAANVENLTLLTGATIGLGNELDNKITGNVVANTLSGADGDDSLIGDAGNDLLDGGIGKDTLSGDAGDDSLTGGDDNDSLLGGDNNDSLDGGAGKDALAGGLGADTYVVDDTNDTITETGADIDTVNSSASYILGANVENLTLTTGANINGTGNTSANIIAGNGGNNTLSGLDGDDSLSGNAGTDTLSGGNNNDTLSGGIDVHLLWAMPATICSRAARAPTRCRVARRQPRIRWPAAPRTISTSSTWRQPTRFWKTLAKASTPSNRPSHSRLPGSPMSRISCSTELETSTAPAIPKRTRSPAIPATISSTAAARKTPLTGGDGNDTLIGGTENDSLIGGIGLDSLDGGAGNDTMEGRRRQRHVCRQRRRFRY